MRRTLAFALAALIGTLWAATSLAAPSAAAAGVAPDATDPTGLWDRDDGLGGVRIATCGTMLCGDIVWLKDPAGPAHVGERVLYDLRRTAVDTWSGAALNPEDGDTYAGTLVLAGDHLTTRGCIFGGLICKSVGLTRPRPAPHAALPARRAPG